MVLRTFGHTVALTSPRCAFLSSSMKVRDCPMPPPMLRGMSLFNTARVVGHFQEIHLVRDFKLLPQGLGVDANAHGGQFVAAFS